MSKTLGRIFKPTCASGARVAVALLLTVTGMGAEAALNGRDLDGNSATFEAYYDTDRNISWLATPSVSGLLKWDAAKTWAEGLNVNGISGWRLPTTAVPDLTSCTDIRPSGFFGFGCSGSEMGHLAHVEGITTATPGGFTGLAADWYWSSTRFTDDPRAAYVFRFDSDRFGQFGAQSGDWDYPGVQALHYAWAVHDGDVGLVSGVPEPETYAMLLAGLGLIGTIARRRAKAVSAA